MLSTGSTCSELRGQDGDPSNWWALVEGRQLERPGTPHLCQHGAGDLLPVAVPWHGSCGRPTRGCADERLGPDLLRGRGKSIGEDLDVDNEGFEQNFKLL
jgi:hypothetical protein